MNFKLIYWSILVLFAGSFISETNAQQLTGEQMFVGNRCANCHTIGRGTFVGPDLSGVHKKYTKDEIISWMVNSQDIYKQRNKMPLNEGFPPMPPMNIPPEQAQQIYDYLKDFKIPKDRLKNGVIKGVVNNETLKESVADIEIKLISFLGDIPREEFTSKTNSGGEYEFKELKWDRSYVLSIVFKGVEYATDKLVFSPEQSVKTLDLPVFDISTDDSLIILDSSHVIIQIQGDRASVAELFVFENGANSVYIGSNDINDKKRETLKFNIPKNADAIQFHHGLSEDTVIIKEGELLSTLSVQPGMSRIVFSYEIPITGKTIINKKVNYLTNSQLILISDNGYEADITGLKGGESIAMKNESYFKWSGDDLNKGHEINITIYKPLFGNDITKWLLLLGVIIIIASSVIYSQLYKNKKELSDSTSNDRDQLIKEIAELDDKFEAGDMEEGEYKRLREKKKARIIELTE